MGDRRPSFFSRLFSSKPTARRTTASRTTQQSQPNTTAPTSSPSPPADETSSASPTTTPANPSMAGNANAPSSTTPPASETISAGQTTTSTPTPTTLPIAETQTAENETNLTTNAIPTTPATAETQTAGQATTPSSTTITLTTPLTDETQSQSPSQSNRNTTLAATMPPSSEAQMDNQTTVTSIVPTQPASPFRATTKSQSPPQPSSPSRVAPQSPAMPSSPSRQGSVTPLTPQRTSKLQSPSHSASRSPNQTSPPSTKGVQHTTKEIPHPLSNSQEAPNTVSNGEAPKPATSEQEPLEIQSKTEVKSETVDDSHNQTAFETRPPSSEAQMDNQTTVTSIVPTQPASPFRATTKSQSPPQPSSPSRVAPQSPVMPSSPSRQGSVTPLTPQRTSKLQSPSHSASRSPNQTSLPSTKGVQHTTKEIPHPLSNSHEAPNTVSNGEAPKPATSEQEPLEIQSKTEVKSETVDDSHNQTAFEKSIKQNEMEVEPSKSSELEAATTSTVAQGPETADATQKLDSSSIDAKTKSLLESNANPEETKEVKEVIEETKCEANEKRNDEGNDFKTAKSGSIAQTVEEASITNKSEQMQEVTQGAIDKKEILKTSPFNGKPTKTSSRPRNKSMSAPTHKFTQSSREPVPLHKEIKDDISTFVNRMAIRDPKNSLNDKPVSVITLAGENRGALMHLGSDSSRGEGAIHIHRGYKINPDESPEATIDGEGSWKGKTSEDAEGKEDQPTEAYVNNNTQGINNSIVFKSSIAERNPGVHMIVTHAQNEPTKSTDEKRPLEVQKAEFNTIPSQKLTYESNVRRRCLQGLLLESSDSDPENPEKPKRHGCRVGREERRKYNTRDVL